MWQQRRRTKNEGRRLCLTKNEGFKTKTIKKPSSIAGSPNLTLDESSESSENKLSAAPANSSTCISTDAAIADGDKQEINHSFQSTDCTDVLQEENVFCGKATGFEPAGVVNPNLGCDVNGGLTMEARLQSQTDVHSTQSDSEDNSIRGFSEGAVFVNNNESGFCQYKRRRTKTKDE